MSSRFTVTDACHSAPLYRVSPPALLHALQTSRRLGAAAEEHCQPLRELHTSTNRFEEALAVVHCIKIPALAAELCASVRLHYEVAPASIQCRSAGYLKQGT
jgi:hypothetical protein